ncbi:substrate-binding periplasmic protein [Vibrio sp. HN007]|uniref:substrate-binding periplasmic protein n=1 Tax=Vibrio iocasae TaxID=3098914 RepID=UPI0035D3F209
MEQATCFRLVKLSIVLSVLLTAISTPASERTLNAVTLDYPPYEFLHNGEPRGIAIDLINEATRRAHLNVEFEFLPWSRAVFKAEAGRADILFNAGVNDARKVWGRYGECVLILQSYYLFKRREEAFTVNSDFSNVKSKSIGIRLGYLYGSGSFRQAIDHNKFARVEYTKSTKQSVDMLLGKRMDMFVGDYMPVMSYIKRHGFEDQIDIVKLSSKPGENFQVLTWPTYLLFNKETVPLEYVKKLDRAMAEMKEDGYFEAVYSHYDEGTFPYLVRFSPNRKESSHSK